MNKYPSLNPQQQKEGLFIFISYAMFIYSKGILMYKGCFLLRISLSLSLFLEKKDGFILPIPPLIICIPKIHGQCITMKNYAIYLFQNKKNRHSPANEETVPNKYRTITVRTDTRVLFIQHEFSSFSTSRSAPIFGPMTGASFIFWRQNPPQ